MSKKPFDYRMQPPKKGLSEHARRAMEKMAKRIREGRHYSSDGLTFADEQRMLNGGNIIPSDIPPIWDDLWIDELLD